MRHRYLRSLSSFASFTLMAPWKNNRRKTSELSSYLVGRWCMELSRGKKLNTYWTRFRKLLNSKGQLLPREIQASNRKTRTSKGKNKVKISAIKSAISRRPCRSWPQSIQSQERDRLFTLFFEYVRSLLVSANSIFFTSYYSVGKLEALWFQTLYFLYFVLFYENVRDSLVSITNVLHFILYSE